MRFVSLIDAKRQLQMDHDEDDTYIELLIEAASETIANYLKDGIFAFTNSQGDVEYDSNGDPEGIPKVVQICTLFMIGVFYKDRDGDPDQLYRQGFLPKPVTAMLYPLRDPALG